MMEYSWSRLRSFAMALPPPGVAAAGLVVAAMSVLRMGALGASCWVVNGVNEVWFEFWGLRSMHLLLCVSLSLCHNTYVPV